VQELTNKKKPGAKNGRTLEYIDREQPGTKQRHPPGSEAEYKEGEKGTGERQPPKKKKKKKKKKTKQKKQTQKTNQTEKSQRSPKKRANNHTQPNTTTNKTTTSGFFFSEGAWLRVTEK